MRVGPVSDNTSTRAFFAGKLAATAETRCMVSSPRRPSCRVARSLLYRAKQQPARATSRTRNYSARRTRLICSYVSIASRSGAPSSHCLAFSARRAGHSIVAAQRPAPEPRSRPRRGKWASSNSPDGEGHVCVPCKAGSERQAMISSDVYLSAPERLDSFVTSGCGRRWDSETYHDGR